MENLQNPLITLKEVFFKNNDELLTKGAKIEERDITYKPPFSGISPIHWNEIIGKKVNKNLEPDHILHYNNIL